MAGKSVEQRLADVDLRIRQMEARKRNLAQHVKEQERKERTRRLVQIGAIMARLGVDTVAKAQLLLQVVEQIPEVRDWLGKITAPSPPESAEASPKA